MSTYIGIDNGISGAVAIVSPNGLPTLQLMPVTIVGKDTFIDEERLKEIFMSVVSPFAVFEQGQKNPLFGTKGNFSNGYSFGVVHTALKLCKIPHVCINPRTWQKFLFKDMKGLGNGDTKGASIEFCLRTYPTVSLLAGPRCKKSHDGLADALCLATYGKRLNL